MAQLQVIARARFLSGDDESWLVCATQFAEQMPDDVTSDPTPYSARITWQELVVGRWRRSDFAHLDRLGRAQLRADFRARFMGAR